MKIEPAHREYASALHQTALRPVVRVTRPACSSVAIPFCACALLILSNVSPKASDVKRLVSDRDPYPCLFTRPLFLLERQTPCDILGSKSKTHLSAIADPVLAETISVCAFSPTACVYSTILCRWAVIRRKCHTVYYSHLTGRQLATVPLPVFFFLPFIRSPEPSQAGRIQHDWKNNSSLTQSSVAVSSCLSTHRPPPRSVLAMCVARASSISSLVILFSLHIQ